MRPTPDKGNKVPEVLFALTRLRAAAYSHYIIKLLFTNHMLCVPGKRHDDVRRGSSVTRPVKNSHRNGKKGETDS